MRERWRLTATLCASCAPCSTWLSACYMTTAMATFSSRMKAGSARASSANTPLCTRAASTAVALAFRWDELRGTRIGSWNEWGLELSSTACSLVCSRVVVVFFFFFFKFIYIYIFLSETRFRKFWQGFTILNTWLDIHKLDVMQKD